MKRLKLFIGAAALAAVALTASPVAFAQEDGNRDENGKIVRGPYETNRFVDNWFVSAGGGVDLFMNKGYKTKVGLDLDANVGKWFTPSVGMRIGYSGVNANSWADTPSELGRTLDPDKDLYLQKFGYMYIHGDFLWNSSNAIGGYKETRFWSVIPYAHAGFFRTYGLDGVDFSNNELAMGIGTLHSLRLTERLAMTIDMKTTFVNGRVHNADGVAMLSSVTMGLAVNLGWPGFLRTSTVLTAVETATAGEIAALEAAAVALEAANVALAQDNAKLQKQNTSLTQQMATLQKEEVVLEAAADLSGYSPATVYFSIGQAVLAADEMQHLDYIAKHILCKVSEQGKVYITVMGSADSNTGGQKRNQTLSAARGKYIADMLTGKYGIPADRLVVKSEVVKATADPQLDRAVVFTF
jgi:outer membrane protein OmpA-like peptidoglycan-associated protein